jgi:hypothetical protein
LPIYGYPDIVGARNGRDVISITKIFMLKLPIEIYVHNYWTIESERQQRQALLWDGSFINFCIYDIIKIFV